MICRINSRSAMASLRFVLGGLYAAIIVRSCWFFLLMGMKHGALVELEGKQSF